LHGYMPGYGRHVECCVGAHAGIPACAGGYTGVVTHVSPCFQTSPGSLGGRAPPGGREAEGREDRREISLVIHFSLVFSPVLVTGANHPVSITLCRSPMSITHVNHLVNLADGGRRTMGFLGFVTSLSDCHCLSELDVLRN
jgi:hypothetical protein